MNVLNKQGTGYVPIVIDAKAMQQTRIVNFDSSMVANREMVSVNESGGGLCVNCDNNTHCMLQRSNKMFCELYQ